MHIALITPEFVTEPDCFDGGLANYLQRLSLALLKTGHHPVVFVSSHSNEILQYNGIEVHRIAIKNLFHSKENEFLFHIYQSYIINQYIEKYITNHIIDVIQYSSLAAVGLFRIPNIPVVIRMSAYMPLIEVNQNKQVTELSKLKHDVEEFAIINADAIYSPSQLVAEVVQNKLQTEVKVIEPPFIKDVNEYDFAVYNEKLKNKKYLLYFGTIHIHKGMLTLARMVYSFFRQHPDYYFVFVGKQYMYENQPLIEHIKNEAKEFASKIIHYEKMPHSQLYPIIENAELIVLPSWIDNFPNTCIEAMALSKIVIGTREASFNQIITDCVNGFLFSKDNETELLQTIEKALQLSETERKTIEKYAKERIMQMNPENSIPTLINYYQNVINTFSPKQTSTEYHNQLIDTILTALVESDKLTGYYKDRSIENQKTIESILNSTTYRIGKRIISILKLFKPYKESKVI